MNRKKYLSVAAVGAFVVGLSQSAFADFQLKDNDNHFYFNIGASANYLTPPSFKVDTLGVDPNSKIPLTKLNESSIVPRADLTFGYKFFNYGNTLFTQLFGHENSVEVNAHYFSFDQSDKNKFKAFTFGSVWRIDGTGKSIPVGKYVISNKLNVDHFGYGANIYFKGNKYFTNQKISLNPYFGLVYNNIGSNYKYVVQYTTGIGIFNINKNYEVSSNYFGGILGGRLNYNINSKVAIFSDLSGQLLYVDSFLDAYQKIVQTTITTLLKVRDSRSTTTYRAKLGLGINIKFTNKPTAPSFELQAGIDRLGDWPEVIAATKTSKVHLDGEAVNNYFAGLTLHIPFA